MSPVPRERLERALKRVPLPILDLEEDERWLRVGEVRLSKRGARVSVGFTHPIDAGTRFGLQRFELGDRKGAAVVLSGAGPLPDYFAGWVPDSAEAKAEAWVARLNAEIADRVSHAKREFDAGRASQTLIFHLGSEYAPDSPWGGEMIELSRTGEIEYEQRKSGSVVRTVRGEVDPSQVQRLLTLLAATNFPSPLQQFFPPGASVCTLITEPPLQAMHIDLHPAGHTTYEEIIRTLASLAKALRESDQDELQRWSLQVAGA
ncbi:MAG: hypothetical protein JNL83_09095 [Myxococcales bacterium]|nr:hypothetical protein [Myxococcales bacterium]